MTRKWEINYDLQDGDPFVFLGVHALRCPYHIGVEPTVAFCDIEDESDEEIERLRADNARLLEMCKELLAAFEGYEMLAALDSDTQDRARTAIQKAEGDTDA